MKSLWLIPALCLTLFLTVSAAAETTATKSLSTAPAETEYLVAPSVSQDRAVSAAVMPPEQTTNPLVVIGSIIALAALAIVVGWGLTNRTTTPTGGSVDTKTPSLRFQ